MLALNISFSCVLLPAHDATSLLTPPPGGRTAATAAAALSEWACVRRGMLMHARSPAHQAPRNGGEAKWTSPSAPEISTAASPSMKAAAWTGRRDPPEGSTSVAEISTLRWEALRRIKSRCSSSVRIEAIKSSSTVSTSSSPQAGAEAAAVPSASELAKHASGAPSAGARESRTAAAAAAATRHVKRGGDIR